MIKQRKDIKPLLFALFIGASVTNASATVGLQEPCVSACNKYYFAHSKSIKGFEFGYGATIDSKMMAEVPGYSPGLEDLSKLNMDKDKFFGIYLRVIAEVLAAFTESENSKSSSWSMVKGAIGVSSCHNACKPAIEDLRKGKKIVGEVIAGQGNLESRADVPGPLKGQGKALKEQDDKALDDFDNWAKMVQK